MPLLRITTSAALPPDGGGTLLASLSGEIARRLSKPEAYVMTSLSAGVSMTFAGTPAPACFVELMNIGTFAPATTSALSSFLCARLAEGLGVPSARIYVSFVNAVGHLWGHDGETFG